MAPKRLTNIRKEDARKKKLNKTLRRTDDEFEIFNNDYTTEFPVKSGPLNLIADFAGNPLLPHLIRKRDPQHIENLFNDEMFRSQIDDIDKRYNLSLNDEDLLNLLERMNVITDAKFGSEALQRVHDILQNMNIMHESDLISITSIPEYGYASGDDFFIFLGNKIPGRVIGKLLIYAEYVHDLEELKDALEHFFSTKKTTEYHSFISGAFPNYKNFMHDAFLIDWTYKEEINMVLKHKDFMIDFVNMIVAFRYTEIIDFLDNKNVRWRKFLI